MQVKFPWPHRQLLGNGKARGQHRGRLTKAQRDKAAQVAWDAGLNPMVDMLPVLVTFHPPPRGTRDRTNMIIGWKATEDGISDALGVDDATFTWSPAYGEKRIGGEIVVTFQEVPAKTG